MDAAIFVYYRVRKSLQLLFLALLRERHFEEQVDGA